MIHTKNLPKVSLLTPKDAKYFATVLPQLAAAANESLQVRVVQEQIPKLNEKQKKEKLEKEKELQNQSYIASANGYFTGWK